MADFKFFIVPRGRTGGTLLATMLNAHPSLSMCYEIYPDLLMNADGTAFDPDKLAGQLRATRKRDGEAWVKGLERDNFRVFAARARRSGIEPPVLLNILEDFVAGGRTFESLEDRLDYIDALLARQARDAGKPYAGGKMRVDPLVLHRRHPEAVYLMMLRDGRDVLDSRLHVGNFKTSPAACAREWSEDLEGFEAFLAESGAKGRLLPYETLVANPRSVLEPVMEMAGLAYDPVMADFTSARQPLFENAHGHLSAGQLKSGLNASSIGRWRNSLTREQLDEFMDVAGPVMKKFGYE